MKAYSRFFPDLFAAAQRFRMASAMRLRAAGDMLRFFGAAFFALPGGRPRRLPVEPPTPSSAVIAASSLPRCSLSC